jgi:hypothetical protein
MKIVVISGVGYQNNDDSIKCLMDKIKKKIECQYEIFKWNNTPAKTAMQTSSLELLLNKTLETSYSPLRRFVAEVIMDFEFALKYGGVIDVTEADYYIGHSAGTLFTMAQDKPSTMMGSPVALVKYLPTIANSENLFINSILDNDKSILNIINKYDVVAYPLNEPEVENVYFCGSKLNPMSYFPLTAHTGYWKSDFVANQIIKHIKSVIK